MTTGSSTNEAFARRSLVHNRREEIDRLQTELLAAVESRGFDESGTFAIRLALEEALSNAFKHGNKDDPAKPVNVSVSIDAGSVVIDIEDQGDGFDPETVPDPTEEENVEIPAGRGLTLMRAFMTNVDIVPPGNRVRMIYERPRSA
ncbi:MAG: ATP-binding protein [Planctomycetota bacterium]|jgi:serine/threonine-protein kinase RsbW